MGVQLRTGRPTLPILLTPSEQDILLMVALAEDDLFLPDRPTPAQDRTRSHRRVEAIGTNDGILDTATIDAACAGVERVRLDVQIIEDFTDQ